MGPGTKIHVSVEEEFERNPELNKKDLDHLREWAQSQKHLPLVPDHMLVWFLQSCYFNMEKAQACMECYFTVRSSAPLLFTDRDINNPQFRKYVDGLSMAMLPVLDPHGSQIFMHALRDTDPANFNHLYDNKLVYMTTDAWLCRKGTAKGFVIILDMKGSKMAHLTKINFSVMRISSKYVQFGSPVRLKAVHVVNAVPWVDKLFAIMKPFIQKDIFDLIQIHKEGTSTLFNFVPRECLPSDYGGVLPPLKELSDENVKILESFKEYFIEDEKLRIDESKRDKRKKKMLVLEEEVTTSQFGKLEID